MAQPHAPTDDRRLIARGLAAIGTPQTRVARILRIDAKTLRKHYCTELDSGTAIATATVARTLFDRATQGGPQDVTAMIFWLKARAGWRDR